MWGDTVKVRFFLCLLVFLLICSLSLSALADNRDLIVYYAVGSSSAYRYHASANCSSLSRSTVGEITLYEAASGGYTPCTRCHPPTPDFEVSATPRPETESTGSVIPWPSHTPRPSPSPTPRPSSTPRPTSMPWLTSSPPPEVSQSPDLSGVMTDSTAKTEPSRMTITEVVILLIVFLFSSLRLRRLTKAAEDLRTKSEEYKKLQEKHDQLEKDVEALNSYLCENQPKRDELERLIAEASDNVFRHQLRVLEEKKNLTQLMDKRYRNNLEWQETLGQIEKNLSALPQASQIAQAEEVSAQKQKLYSSLKQEFTSLYEHRTTLECSGAPKYCYVAEDGLPAIHDGGLKWGYAYTFYKTPNGGSYHTVYCYHSRRPDRIAINAYNVRKDYLLPCSHCNPTLPDLSWYEQYLEVKARRKKYEIPEPADDEFY